MLFFSFLPADNLVGEDLTLAYHGVVTQLFERLVIHQFVDTKWRDEWHRLKILIFGVEGRCLNRAAIAFDDDCSVYSLATSYALPMTACDAGITGGGSRAVRCGVWWHGVSMKSAGAVHDEVNVHRHLVAVACMTCNAINCDTQRWATKSLFARMVADLYWIQTDVTLTEMEKVDILTQRGEGRRDPVAPMRQTC